MKQCFCLQLKLQAGMAIGQDNLHKAAQGLAQNQCQAKVAQDHGAY